MGEAATGVKLYSFFCGPCNRKFRAPSRAGFVTQPWADCPWCGQPCEQYRKYKNQPVIVDGVHFDAKGEAEYDGQLRLVERQGGIRDLKRQVAFEIQVPDLSGVLVKICTYVADWVYWDVEQKAEMVVDWKGKSTREFKLKKKLMRARFGIEIQEVGRKRSQGRRRRK